MPEYKYITTPIMVAGVLYATAGLQRAVVAIDAASGETLWTYRFDEGERVASAPRRNSGRGVAWWSDGRGDNRLLVVTHACHLLALDVGMRPRSEQNVPGHVRGFDVRTGRQLWRFNTIPRSGEPGLGAGQLALHVQCGGVDHHVSRSRARAGLSADRSSDQRHLWWSSTR
ncbi:MAG: PQQ-binding-like beta-propeller repeat protein [Pseudomonadales bacterium]